jgi:hypothetical protein
MPYREYHVAPIEVFTSMIFENYKHLERCHVWGSPVFVLDPALQDGKKIPKWDPRSRLGIYLGHSPLHSSTVARDLNLGMGYITAHYHAVHGNMCSTVHNNGTALGIWPPNFGMVTFELVWRIMWSPTTTKPEI